MTDDLKFFVTLYGGVIASVCLLIALDWLGRRRDHKSNTHKPA